ncbi:hypothetical protein Pyn_32976 [Prunus yedoensis var. nudiflora]|uniref:Uncharacterized protein n=1 Tax=Prunus yedoensis var. nudiflora TaxID=2094558 RepID=A0A314YMR1_PRUYE|nr:hypothetical protein Pyn_32976 [Prunus yedoensis var. nudiflora]
MAERKRTKTTSTCSPLATVEEIQRRLVRPSSTSISPPPTSTFSSSSTYTLSPLSLSLSTHTPLRNSSVISISIADSRVSCRDYVQSCHKAPDSSQFKLRTTTKKLEDYLDSVLLSQISSKLSRAKKVPETKLEKREVKDFEWPIDELKVLADSDKDDVNLKEDLDLIEEFGDRDVESCTPFRRFEQITARRFKG